jgi:signal transduction histidine kinase
MTSSQTNTFLPPAVKWNSAARRLAVRLWLSWSAVFIAFMFALVLAKPASQPILLPIVLGLVLGALAAWVYAPVHIRRTYALVGTLTDETLANRHYRRIEVTMPIDVTFEMLKGVFVDLPGIELRRTEPELHRIHAHVERLDAYGINFTKSTIGDHVLLMVSHPSSDAGSNATIELWSGPNMPRWLDWALPDLGNNLQHTESICRVIARRVAERRAKEQAEADKLQLAKQISEARLAALQSQVEPHFLYNTLATAQVLTRSDPERAYAMMGHLINFLRAGLRSEAGRSRLSDELDRLVAYLEIMKVRMGKRLDFDIRIPDNLRAHTFPAMVLQMLVENAIKHGLEPKPAGGSVVVDAREADGSLIVEVRDDGRGIGEGTAGSGVGLRNIRERLQLEYGDGASFSLASNQPVGIIARVMIPLDKSNSTN